MPVNSLLVRILAAGLPIAVIALIAGAAGYVTKDTERAPIPPLPAAEERDGGVLGAVQSFSNGQLTVVTADGTPRTFSLTANATIERLAAIARDELRPGDWINGGAIPHAQTVLALVGLVLLPDPVVGTP